MGNHASAPVPKRIKVPKITGLDAGVASAGGTPIQATIPSTASPIRPVDISEARSTAQLEGRFIGKDDGWGPWNKGDMAFLVRKDPNSPGNYYAILGDYNRFSLGEWVLRKVLGDDLTFDTPDDKNVTFWVPRMELLYVSHVGNGRYDLSTMRSIKSDLTKGGDIVGTLETKSGQMKGAVLKRYDAGGKEVADEIKFDGTQASSTWEPYVPGDYFLSKNSLGFDYFGKGVNVTFATDRTVTFNLENRTGSYIAFEKAPGIFTLKAVDPRQPGANEVEKKILVFVDVMNWKPSKKTNEALLIDPNDPDNLDFLYERGANQ